MTAAGLLLAAGGGERFGQPKALLRLGGETLAARGRRLLAEGGCDPVVVVSGAVEVEGAVANPAWSEGIGSSLRRGLEALDGAEAAVVALADQPLVGPDAVRRLVAAWREGAGAAVATYDGRPGNPVLLDRRLWRLAAEHAVGDVGARALLRARPDLVTLVPCDGTGSPADVDEPRDALRLVVHTVLFDLDGVLVDSRGPITSCIKAALFAHGFAEPSEAELLACIGPPLGEALAGLAGLDSAQEAADLVATYRAAYRDVAAQAPVVDGVRGLLDGLGATHRLGVVTSKGRVFAEAILRHHRLDGVFEVIAGPELEAGTEPKTVTLGRALAGIGIAGGIDVALVGDRHHDVAAALAHGLLSVGVTWGIGSPEELRDAGAHLLVDTPASFGRLVGNSRPTFQDSGGGGS